MYSVFKFTLFWVSDLGFHAELVKQLNNSIYSLLAHGSSRQKKKYFIGFNWKMEKRRTCTVFFFKSLPIILSITVKIVMGIFFPENVGQQIVSTIVLLDKALQCWPRKAVRMRGNTSSFLFFVVNHVTTISAKSVELGEAWAAQITQLHTMRGSKLSAISCFWCIFYSHLHINVCSMN